MQRRLAVDCLERRIQDAEENGITHVEGEVLFARELPESFVALLVKQNPRLMRRVCKAWHALAKWEDAVERLVQQQGRRAAAEVMIRSTHERAPDMLVKMAKKSPSRVFNNSIAARVGETRMQAEGLHFACYTWQKTTPTTPSRRLSEVGDLDDFRQYMKEWSHPSLQYVALHVLLEPTNPLERLQVLVDEFGIDSFSHAVSMYDAPARSFPSGCLQYMMQQDPGFLDVHDLPYSFRRSSHRWLWRLSLQHGRVTASDLTELLKRHSAGPHGSHHHVPVSYIMDIMPLGDMTPTQVRELWNVSVEGDDITHLPAVRSVLLRKNRIHAEDAHACLRVFFDNPLHAECSKEIPQLMSRLGPLLDSSELVRLCLETTTPWLCWEQLVQRVSPSQVWQCMETVVIRHGDQWLDWLQKHWEGEPVQTD